MLVEKFLGCCELEKALIAVAWWEGHTRIRLFFNGFVFRIDIAFSTLTLQTFALFYAMLMKDCDKMKVALENVHIDDCELFKTGKNFA